jgi:type II secretory pathway pseudopilin PulG
MKQMRNKSEGFALLEVIISIVLLGFFLAGATTLIWSAINASSRNRDRITATYLTQECLELARNARDTAWRQYLPWDCAFDVNCSQQNELDTLISIEYITEMNGNDSKFGRQLRIDPSFVPGESQSIKMTCSTFWQVRKNERGEEVSMSQVLTNWKKK